MVCKNCGADMGSGVTECPYCGTLHSEELSSPATVTGISVNQPRMSAQVTNPLVGKEYSFSGNDLVIRGRWGINYTVSVGEDRLNIKTVPARKNKTPVIILEDITAIQESFHMRTANIVIGVIGLVLGCFGAFWGFLFPVLVILLFRERKMKIHTRNGQVLTIYSNNKASITPFVEDMKKITSIQK